MRFDFQFLGSFPDPLSVSAFVVSQLENTLHVVSGLGVGGLCWAPTQSVLVGTLWALEGRAFCSWALCLRTLHSSRRSTALIRSSIASLIFFSSNLIILSVPERGVLKSAVMVDLSVCPFKYFIYVFMYVESMSGGRSRERGERLSSPDRRGSISPP